MRGAESFDGKLAGNRQLVDSYNEAKGKGKKKGLKGALHGGPGTQPGALPKAGGGESSGAREPGGHDEIKDVVNDHGAAVSHHIMKTNQGYHSISHHEDGHVHHAEHDTLADAHEHGAAAFDDTEHMGDMPKDDYETAEEERGVEENPSRQTSRVGYMS